jgi:hypothetical protein
MPLIFGPVRSWLQEKRERRTSGDGLARQEFKLRWHLTIGDDRVPPVVQRDDLGEQFRTQPVRIAPDGVDDQSHPARPGKGRAGERPDVALHPPLSWTDTSSAKVANRLRVNRPVPSG